MDQTIRMLEKFTEYELKASELYMLYSNLYPEEKGFWFEMSLEEKDHASLIKSSIVYVKIGKFPAQMAYDCLESVDAMIAVIDGRIETFSLSAPEKCEACRFALLVEASPCEQGFRDAMMADTEDRVMQILQRIGRMDALHHTKVERLMEKLGCPPLEDT